MVTRDKRRTQRETIPSATLSVTDAKGISLVLNSNLRGERSTLSTFRKNWHLTFVG